MSSKQLKDIEYENAAAYRLLTFLSVATGVFAGQRLVRLWEQFVHFECAFMCTMVGNLCTTALFSAELNERIDVNELVRSVRFRMGTGENVGAIGKFTMEMDCTILAGIAQLDRQPAIRRRGGSSTMSLQYLYRLPIMLLSAMAVDAARSCLESVAFVLVAWGRTSSETYKYITLMETAADRIRSLSTRSSSQGASSIAQVAADYIDEMIDTIQLWQLYYRVYRPGSSIQAEASTPALQSEAGSRNSTSTSSTGSVDPLAGTPRTAMDFLASAAQAMQGSAVEQQQYVRSNAQAQSVVAPTAFEDMTLSQDGHELGWNEKLFDQLQAADGGRGYNDLVDPSIYTACIPFDLEAFLKDVDQLGPN